MSNQYDDVIPAEVSSDPSRRSQRPQVTSYNVSNQYDDVIPTEVSSDPSKRSQGQKLSHSMITSMYNKCRIYIFAM